MTVLADRYELGDVLGEGGMGRVVVAHDRVLRRDVAVKLLTSAPDAASKARFLREARDSARLRHPNAVTVFDTGEHDGRPFIVMELVRGTTLAELVEQDGPLDVEVAVAITAGVLEALAAAHDAGLVHRDVKPGNVMLPDDGGVKLTDFGIARAMDSATTSLTAAGTVLGTPTYLAPELVEGGTAQPASDLYAVGCLLYFQLAGEPPFTAETPLAIAYAHLNREVRPIEEHRPDVPPELRLVLTTALAKDPAERYGDATQMYTALLGGGPVVAPDEGTLPLTAALTPSGAASGAGPDAGSGSAAGSSAGASAGTAGSAGVGGSTQRADADPTQVIRGNAGADGTRGRSPWMVFALVALVLVAIGAFALAQSFGGDDATEEPGTVDGSDQDVTDGSEGSDGSEEGTDPDPSEPGTDETDAPDGSDGSDGSVSPDEPAPGSDDPAEDVAPEPPADEEPPPDEAPPSEEPPADGDDGGGGQEPDGDGPPGQDVPPGQEG